MLINACARRQQSPSIMTTHAKSNFECLTNPGKSARGRFAIGAIALLALGSGCGRTKGDGPSPVVQGPRTDASPDAQAAHAEPRAPRIPDPVDVILKREITRAATLNPAGFEKVKALRPVLTCVETVSETEGVARFGYANESAAEVEVPVGVFNRFWPPPIGQGQPTKFAPGTKVGVVKVPFKTASSVAWVLGREMQMADVHSPACPAKKPITRRHKS